MIATAVSVLDGCSQTIAANRQRASQCSPMDVLAGTCKYTTVVSVLYEPAKRGPLSRGSSKGFTMSCVDERPSEERTLIGTMPGPPEFLYQSKEPPTTIACAAINTELAFNGHHLQVDGKATPDVDIAVALKKFWVTFAGRKALAKIEAEVSVESAGTRRTIFVQGTSEAVGNKWFSVTANDPSEELGYALSDFVRSLCFSPQFVEAFF